MIEKPLRPEAKLIDAIRAIEISRRRMAVVVDADNCLVGTLTDGDIRRHLLAGGSLDEQVEKAMNLNPLSAQEGAPDGYIKDLMSLGNVAAIPMLNQDSKYLRLVHLIDLKQDPRPSDKAARFSFAVIMAGGEGTRLRPLTETIPKSMIEIGGIPLLARQIQRLAKIEIPRIYISINFWGT